jgi:hypothetical protein
MTITEGMTRAARLDASLYEEVEADPTLTGQATAIVLLSALAAGIGAARLGPANLVAAAVIALLSWYVWAGLTYLIGTRLLPEPQTKADFGQLLRTIGFASSPGVVRVLGILPGLTDVVFIVAGIWMLVAMVVAVRQALDYTSTWRAGGVVLIGWVVYSLLLRLALRGAFLS